MEKHLKPPIIAAAILASIGAPARCQATSSRAAFYEPPQLFVMTGFIANTTSGTWGQDFIGTGMWTPEKQQQALAQWNKGLGRAYDADKTVLKFKEAGATGIIFYDKWHDGLVPHDTALTGFKTERDLAGATIRAARRHGLKIVVHYSVGLDANPEPRFLEWACRDASGNPVGLAFPADWKSLHSPYRRYAVDQMVEILKKYGPVNGFYLDLYTQPPLSHDQYTRRAFRERYGKPGEQATPAEITGFGIETLRELLVEIRAALAEVQPDIAFTFNGAGMGDIVQPKSAKQVEGLVDWFSMEGHRWSVIDRVSRLGHNMDRPFEVGVLLNSSWYVPMGDDAPPPSMSEDEAIASTATAWVQGSNIFAAMTPGHSGVFDERGDLRLLRAAGRWLKENRPWIAGATPYADVGLVLGNPSSDLAQIPQVSELWRLARATNIQAVAAGLHATPPRPGESLDLALRNAGYFTDFVGTSFPRGAQELRAFRMLVLPENALLDDRQTAAIREYVRGGGKLLAFGHASLLEATGSQRLDFALGDVFGAAFAGNLPGYKQLAPRPEAGFSAALRLNPAALAVRPGSAKVLAVWRSAGDAPAILENSFGSGRAIYVSTEESACGTGSGLLEELAGRLIGLPPVSIQAARTYSFLMNRKGGDLLLYIFNRSTGSRAFAESGEAPDPAVVSAPEQVRLTLNTGVLGEVGGVEILPHGTRAGLSRRLGYVQVSFAASPAVTTLRLRRSIP